MRTLPPIFLLKRDAKRLARSQSLPWLAALDQIAQREGFQSWSLLQSKANKAHTNTETSTITPQRLYQMLSPGECWLIASRPGFGKTRIALQTLQEAYKHGNKGTFFSLDFTQSKTKKILASFDGLHDQSPIKVDCSDTISSDYIITQCQPHARKGDLFVIDYLQLLDQKRSTPPLQAQVQALKQFADDTQCILLFLSQIDRSFEESEKSCPDWEDIRLPNPLDLSLFDQGLFRHHDQMALLTSPLSSDLLG